MGGVKLVVFMFKTAIGSNLFLLRKVQVGGIVTFRSAKVARVDRYFRGAKGDKRLSATETNLVTTPL
jgi:hypothetical protein